MQQLLKGIYWTIYGYINEAQKRADHLITLIAAARNGEYDEEALKAYEDAYKCLGKEIQVLSNLAEEIKHTS